MTCFQWRDHTADLRLLLEAADFIGLLRCLVRALADAMVPGLMDGPLHEEPFAEDVGDEAEALVVLANECIYRILVLGQVPLELHSVRLDVPRFEVVLKFLEPSRVLVEREIKAATYSGLLVEHKGDSVRASIVFDV